MERLTRQQVINRVKETGDLSGYDLSGLMLSNLDLISVRFQVLQSKWNESEQFKSQHVLF